MDTPIGAMRARAMLLLGSVDLPARAILLNMKHFNGMYGCLYCHHPGETEPGNHLHRFWPDKPDTKDLRTMHSILRDAKEATEQGKAVSYF